MGFVQPLHLGLVLLCLGAVLAASAHGDNNVDDDQTHDADGQLIGGLIEIVGTTLSVLGLNAQKHALMLGRKVADGRTVPLRGCCSVRVRWLCGFALFLLGQLVEGAAL